MTAGGLQLSSIQYTHMAIVGLLWHLFICALLYMAAQMLQRVCCSWYRWLVCWLITRMYCGETAGRTVLLLGVGVGSGSATLCSTGIGNPYE